LSEHVAYRSGLGGTCDHRQSADVSGQLAEELVVRAAPDDLHDVCAPAGKSLDIPNCVAVGEHQTVQNAGALNQPKTGSDVSAPQAEWLPEWLPKRAKINLGPSFP
jgi:hypothetical protein